MSQSTLERNTVVVDITYLCNAECRYCQWGDTTTPGRMNLELKDVLIPEYTLKVLGTKRVVLSGGEPRIHPHIQDILKYYSKLVNEVIIITNGYELDKKTITSLLKAGATGITISLDSINPIESFMTRRTPPELHKKILNNLRYISNMECKFELGINSTISSMTANWFTVRELLEFGLEIHADFVKFQPIFDDGYVSKNSSELLLGADCVASLLYISSHIHTLKRPPTNPAGFWRDVAVLAKGKMLSGAGCALNSHDAIITGGNMNVCYWVESSQYSHPTRNDHISYNEAISKFDRDKQHCNVGFHCFCNQGMGHTWKNY